MKKRTPASPMSKPAARKTPAAKEAVVAADVMVVTVSSDVDGPGADAPPVELQRVRFGYFNPDASEVFVVGSFNNWDQRATPMRRDALGDWSVHVELPPDEYRYRLMVDGEWRDEPSAQVTARNPFGGYDVVLVVVG